MVLYKGLAPSGLSGSFGRQCALPSFHLVRSSACAQPYGRENGLCGGLWQQSQLELNLLGEETRSDDCLSQVHLTFSLMGGLLSPDRPGEMLCSHSHYFLDPHFQRVHSLRPKQRCCCCECGWWDQLPGSELAKSPWPRSSEQSARCSKRWP
jgi:hypothetical protein